MKDEKQKPEEKSEALGSEKKVYQTAEFYHKRISSVSKALDFISAAIESAGYDGNQLSEFNMDLVKGMVDVLRGSVDNIARCLFEDFDLDKKQTGCDRNQADSRKAA